MRSIYSSRGKAGSLQHRAVCQRDDIAVEVDGAVVGEARKRAVAGQVPRAAVLDRDNRVVADGGAALGIVDDVDGAGEGAAVFHRHRERRDGIDDDVACKRLTVCGEFDLCAVAAGGSPAAAGGVADHAQQRAVRIIVDDIHAGKRQQAVGVRDVEHVTAAANEAAAGHREDGRADVRVAAHGLIDHHVVDVFRRARTLGVAHVAGGIAVFERDGVLTLDDKGFGVVRRQVRILHGDVRRGVDRGGVVAVRGVRAAAHVDRTAAAVGADGRGRVAGGLDN